MLDEHLNTLLDVTERDGLNLGSDPVESEKSVSRMTMRQVLLTGLEDIVRFDKRFSHYEIRADSTVEAYFEDGTSVVADILVGADGSNSRVRRWARLEEGRQPRLRYAFRRHFRAAPWTDHMEIHWGDRCQGYATAVGRDQVCVALASHDRSMRLEAGLRELPTLKERLRGAEMITDERGALTGNRALRKVWRGNVALIGDASGTVDAITGEGLGLAFGQAVALAESFQTGDLDAYQKEHRRLMLRPRGMARLMLTLDGRPWLQQRTLQTFRKHPEIFRRLLALHLGVLTPLRLERDGLTLGWGLLTA